VDIAGLKAEPVVEDIGIYAAIVGRKSWITPVKIDEVGLRAIQSARDSFAEQQHRGRGSVVGAARTVLRQRASEFGESHDCDPVVESVDCQVLPERGNRRGDVAAKVCVAARRTALV